MRAFDKLTTAVHSISSESGKLAITKAQGRELIQEFLDRDALLRQARALIEQYEDLNRSLREALDKEKEACKEWRLKAYADQQAVISMQAVVDNLTKQLDNIKKVIK